MKFKQVLQEKRGHGLVFNKTDYLYPLLTPFFRRYVPFCMVNKWLVMFELIG
jgi:hypothetical protein